MTLLTRYLMKEFGRLFALCLGGGVALYAVIDVFDRINSFIRHGAAIKWILLFVLFKIPLMVYQIVPAAMLLAVLLTLGLLARHNEILALRTSGIPVLRLAYPFVCVACLVSVAAFLLNEFVVAPAYQQSLYIRRILIEEKTPYTAMVRNRIWFKGREGIFRVASFLPQKNEMQGVTLFTIERPFRLARRIDASRARWEDGKWIFYDVEVRSFPGRDEMKSSRSDRMEIALVEVPEDFQVLRTKTDEMSFAELRRYIRKIESEGYDSTPYRVQLQKKIAFPVLNIITAFLGIPFALRLPRFGGLAAVVGLSLVVGFLYWVLFAVTISVGQAGVLPPFVAAWTANALFAALGLYLLLRVEDKPIS